MNETKPWWQSHATWASLATIAASIVGGVKAEEVDTAAGLIVSIATGIGGLWSLFGRLKARRRLTR